jgi:hypothetical protein
VSIYGKNDGPEVEGGMVIKQEAGENGENDTPIIGLAKFSLLVVKRTHWITVHSSLRLIVCW